MTKPNYGVNMGWICGAHVRDFEKWLLKMGFKSVWWGCLARVLHPSVLGSRILPVFAESGVSTIRSRPQLESKCDVRLLNRMSAWLRWLRRDVVWMRMRVQILQEVKTFAFLILPSIFAVQPCIDWVDVCGWKYSEESRRQKFWPPAKFEPSSSFTLHHASTTWAMRSFCWKASHRTWILAVVCSESYWLRSQRIRGEYENQAHWSAELEPDILTRLIWTPFSKVTFQNLGHGHRRSNPYSHHS